MPACRHEGQTRACLLPLSISAALNHHAMQPYRLVEYAPRTLALGAVAFLPMQLAWLRQRTYLSEWLRPAQVLGPTVGRALARSPTQLAWRAAGRGVPRPVLLCGTLLPCAHAPLPALLHGAAWREWLVAAFRLMAVAFINVMCMRLYQVGRGLLVQRILSSAGSRPRALHAVSRGMQLATESWLMRPDLCNSLACLPAPLQTHLSFDRLQQWLTFWRLTGAEMLCVTAIGFRVSGRGHVAVRWLWNWMSMCQLMPAGHAALVPHCTGLSRRLACRAFPSLLCPMQTRMHLHLSLQLAALAMAGWNLASVCNHVSPACRLRILSCSGWHR